LKNPPTFDYTLEVGKAVKVKVFMKNFNGETYGSVLKLEDDITDLPIGLPTWYVQIQKNAIQV